MKRMKVVLSWILAIMMMTTLLTGFQTVSAASLAAVGITLDDAAAVATESGNNAYTVKIPDGRPRIPQVICEGAEITQAFIADDQTQGTAKVVKDGVTYTVTFVKDASLGFVLQYDDHYTWNSGLTGTVSYTSSDSSVATVESSTGEIVVVAVSDSGATITATNGSATKELVITKTIKAVLGVWMLTGQSNTTAYYSNEGGTSIRPQAGTAYYSGPMDQTSMLNYKTKMTPMGTTIGGIEPVIAKTFYNKTGEKVFIMNAGVSGSPVSEFLPGVSNALSGNGTGTWKLINAVYENAVAEFATADFQSKYETRMRSFFYLQGCADTSKHWTTHYNGIAVTKNTNAFTTAGTTYPAGSHTFFSYMTEVIGFDACLDLMVAWRPTGIIASSRTAQFKLAEDFDNYHIASRLIQTMSEEQGTYRGDRLHINQLGKNIVGQHAGGYAVRYYTGGELVEAATGATAFFNKIGYEDGETFYVQPGDFYNYCTRPHNLTSDDQFVYKFSGEGADMIDYDGKNDFVVKKDAIPGTTAVMEIYSEGNLNTPITTLTLQIVGERADAYTAVDSNTYEWTFDDNKNPTTVKGDIDLTRAEEFGDKGTLELSEDLWLDCDGYWSVEWKSDGVGQNSYFLASAPEYSKMSPTFDSSNAKLPNFIFVSFVKNVGWTLYRDTGYQDYFWRSEAGTSMTGEHVFKMECRNNVYTFSIDGEIMDSRAITEGASSYAADSTVKVTNTDRLIASATEKGRFDNRFNVHYLLGGTNTNGNKEGHMYGYDGDVEYVKISIGDENPEITAINDEACEPVSGTGTKDDPYIVNVEVDEGTVIDESSFAISAPKGAATFSADKFGGKALTTVSCDTTEQSVYTMILGSIPSMSTFYKTNFIVDIAPEDVVAVNGDKQYTNLTKAAAAAKAGETVTLLEDVTVDHVAVNPGTVLDLNGNTLTADHLVGFNTSVIYNGKVVVDKNKVALDKSNNGYLPVYDGQSYEFITVSTQEMTQVEGENTVYYFLPELVSAHNAMLNGAENSGVKIIVRLNWTNPGNYTATQDYVYMDEMVSEVIDSHNGAEYKKVFTATFNGLEAGTVEDLKITAVIVSDTGVEIQSGGIAFDAVNE